MPLTSTSTEMITLVQRLDFLDESFDWIVGGIGVTITIAIALIAIFQFLYLTKINKQAFQSFKSEVQNQLTKKFDDLSLKTDAYIQDSFDKLEQRINKKVEFLDNKVGEHISIIHAKDAIATANYGSAYVHYLSGAGMACLIKDKHAARKHLDASIENLKKLSTESHLHELQQGQYAIEQSKTFLKEDFALDLELIERLERGFFDKQLNS